MLVMSARKATRTIRMSWSPSARQMRDGLRQPVERQAEHREHLVDRLGGAAPEALGLGVEPRRLAEVARHEIEPGEAGDVVVEVLPAPAAGLPQLRRMHERVADDDQL